MGWKLNDLTVATGAPEAEGQPTGYVFDAFGTHHVTYFGVDHDIHELLWDSAGWHHTDLSVVSGVGSFIEGNTAIGYVFHCTRHVIYFGQGVRELWWDAKGWHHNELLSAAGVQVGYTGRPTGYAFIAQGTQHVLFPGLLDRDIHELWRDSSGWHHNNLTGSTGAPKGPANPSGYVFDAQGTQHVLYVGGGDHLGAHICELWWDNSGWHFNDLTVAAGAPLAENRVVSGYMFASQGTQHVNHYGMDKHIHELWWDPEGWHHNDLTSRAGAPDALTEPAGYMFAGSQKVLYGASDNHIHCLSWDNNAWSDNDLTVAAGAPPTYGNPTGYGFEAYGSQHVIYKDNNQHVIELYWTP